MAKAETEVSGRLELPTSFAGAASRPFAVTVGERDGAYYAAAVEDHNARYLDDRHPGWMAPPMCAVRVTWPLMGDFAAHWDLPDFPLDVLRRMVHYTESLYWHRPLVPGQPLTVQGRIAAIVPRRIGCCIYVRADVCEADGAPVFTEYSGALLRGVRGIGEALGVADLPVPPVAEEAEPLWTGRQYISVGAAHVYEACTGIAFPIHTSMRAAETAGLPGTLYHGTATLSRAVGALLDREAGGDPGCVRAVHCRFTAMVRPGTPILVRFLGRSDKEGTTDLFFDVINHEGKPAVSRASLTVAAPHQE